MRKKVLIGFAAVVALLLGYLVVGALTLDSRQIEATPAPSLAFDADAAAARLAEAVRMPTVEFTRDPAPFHAFVEWLEAAYPRVHLEVGRRQDYDGGLLYVWKGTTEAAPLLLLGHVDVVPVADADDWTHPPFGGVVADGFIWGRGTLDDKASVLAMFEAIDALLAEGARPKRAIYLAFGFDEETGGREGAVKLAAELKRRGVKPFMVLDEGSIIAEGIVPGVDRPVALVAVAEKGYLSLELAAEGKGGHSSMPPKMTAAGRVARAVTRLEADPFPMTIDGATAHFMDWLAPEMSFGPRLVLGNRGVTSPIIEMLYERKASTAATLRTTTAVTQLSGSPQENVLPRRATATVNFRILPGDSIASVTERVKEVVDDEAITLTPQAFASEPSPVSDPEGEPFRLIQKTVVQVFPGAVVVPSLTVGAMDARHYVGLSDHIFRFLPVRLTAEDLDRIHGRDERLSLSNHAEMIRFYAQFIRNAAM